MGGSRLGKKGMVVTMAATSFIFLMVAGIFCSCVGYISENKSFSNRLSKT